MQLEDFYDYKNQLMGEILTNSTLISLISNNSEYLEDGTPLAYTQVFPFEYIPETIDGGETFICFDVDIQESYKESMMYNPIIYVWVFAHRSNIRLPEGGVRTDKICSEICKMLNGSRYYGATKLWLASCKRFAPMTDYNGKVMTFKTEEFNLVHNGKQTFPSNRKRS